MALTERVLNASEKIPLPEGGFVYLTPDNRFFDSNQNEISTPSFLSGKTILKDETGARYFVDQSGKFYELNRPDKEVTGGPGYAYANAAYQASKKVNSTDARVYLNDDTYDSIDTAGDSPLPASIQGNTNPGNPSANPTPANPSPNAPGGSTGGGTGGGGQTPTPTPQQQAAAQMTDQQFEEWINSQNLSADQKAAVRALYNAVGTNDQAAADRAIAAIEAGTAYSEPYFRAQANLVKDAFQRGMSNIDGDLAFNEKSLANRLKDIQETIAKSGDYLSFQHLQELKDLERRYTGELETVQDDMANRGFTSSSIRTRKEGILSDTFGDMREASNKNFQYRTDQNDQQLSIALRDTALEKQRLQELAARGKLDLTRSAEEQLGSEALAGMGYTNLVGGVGGSLERQKQQDALSYAANYF